MTVGAWDECLKFLAVLTTWPMLVLFLACLFRKAIANRLSTIWETKLKMPGSRLADSRMTYQRNLKWLANRRDFPREQQMILLALSDDRYKWRSRDRLQAVTELDRDVLDTALAQLIKNS